MSLSLAMAERGLLSDGLIRLGIRNLLKVRLDEEAAKERAAPDGRLAQFLDELRDSPIAIETDAANEQHYEVPPRFFQLALGPHLKYSSCWYDPGVTDIGQAEATMLGKTCERAELVDGQDVLELGCGWGSLTLWMAEHYPNSRITGVSNSAPQREHILGQAKERGLDNVTILTRDVNALELDAASFDRVVSVEMFEHVRNHERLLARIHDWLRPSGKLFVHVFSHKHYAYPFEMGGTGDDDDWMAKYFFTGGVMPSESLFAHMQRDMVLERHWRVRGTHYEKTANDWLRNTDANRDEILSVFAETYGAEDAKLWLQRWRIFFMACAELWGYADGYEWWVNHYRFERGADVRPGSPSIS